MAIESARALAEGNLAAAQKHLQLALQKDPEQPFALINLAAVAIKQGDYKTAHDTLKRAQQSPQAIQSRSIV